MAELSLKSELEKEKRFTIPDTYLGDKINYTNVTFSVPEQAKNQFSINCHDCGSVCMFGTTDKFGDVVQILQFRYMDDKWKCDYSVIAEGKFNRWKKKQRDFEEMHYTSGCSPLAVGIAGSGFTILPPTT